MNRSRLDRLEQKLRQDNAPPALVELLRELKIEAQDTTPTPANMNLADTLRALMIYLPD